MRRRVFFQSTHAGLSRRGRDKAVVGSLALLLALLTPLPSAATPMSGEDPEPQGQSSGTAGGFAFAEPRGFFLIKGGLYVPRGASDVFAFNEDLLTLDAGSYRSGLFGMDVGISLNSRIDLVFGFEYSSSSPVSEFRDFVDEFDAPIVQQTRLRQAPLTASVRLNLIERGRTVGSYAWIPSAAVPYVGGGAAIMWWRYEQFGDFVDFNDFTIFTDHFLTQGWEPSLHVFGGVDVSISPRFAINLEGRYSWAEGQMAPAFVGFEPIDLAGFRATVGASFRF